MIVLDTNVISELLSPRPSATVVEWVGSQPVSSVFTTTITEAEILYGVRLLPEGRRRQELEAAILPIFSDDLSGRILPFDREAANIYAEIATKRRKAGKPISHLMLRSRPYASLTGPLWLHETSLISMSYRLKSSIRGLKPDAIAHTGT